MSCGLALGFAILGLCIFSGDCVERINAPWPKDDISIKGDLVSATLAIIAVMISFGISLLIKSTK